MIEHPERLEGIDERLRQLVYLVGEQQGYPVLAVEGLRSKERQAYLHSIGRSWTLDSRHLDGRAVDLVSAVTGWNDHGALCLLAGLMLGGAHALGITLRWGGDWDRDWTMNTQRHWDAGHYELLDEQ